MKIARKLMKIFGINADNNQRGVFGSMASGSPAYTTDPETIQSLANFEQGWFSAILGNNSPAIEDMNALQFLFSYQLAYLLQQGIPEWNVDTEYYTGSFCQVGGVIYKSLIDNNIGNLVTDSLVWERYVDKEQLDLNRRIAVRGKRPVSMPDKIRRRMCSNPRGYIISTSMGVGGSADVLYSADGGYSFSTAYPGTEDWGRPAVGQNGNFIAMSRKTAGNTHYKVLISPNGIFGTFSEYTTNISTSTFGSNVEPNIVYAPDKDIYVLAITQDSAPSDNALWYSYDGVYWYLGDGDNVDSACGPTYMDHLGRFIAYHLGVGPTSKSMIYSDDGITWEQGNFSVVTDFPLPQITYSPQRREACIATSGGISTSTDGINWTIHSFTAPSTYISWIDHLNGYLFSIAINAVGRSVLLDEIGVIGDNAVMGNLFHNDVPYYSKSTKTIFYQVQESTDIVTYASP